MLRFSQIHALSSTLTTWNCKTRYQTESPHDRYRGNLTIGSTTSTKDEKSQGKPKREIDTHSIISLAGNKESMGKPKTFSKKNSENSQKKWTAIFYKISTLLRKGPSFSRFPHGGGTFSASLVARVDDLRTGNRNGLFFSRRARC